MPLRLFRNRVFSVASAIGFVVGMSLFGSVTYIPLYLQVVKGASPTASGLQLLPLMAGVLVSSIGSGQLIARFGRYKVFPIVGTALSVVGLLLLSRLGTGTSTVLADLYMAVLGLGLGLVMQVLVLAVQNAVDYKNLGVATSTATLFRSMGGTIGVPVFGAIFANQLASHVAGRLPLQVIEKLPSRLGPSQIDALPPAIRDPYVAAWAAALRPIFLIAAAIAALGFVLSWFLKELPLRETVADQGLRDSFAAPRDATSLEELETRLSTLARKQNRHVVYDRLTDQAGLDLPPNEAWVVLRLAEGTEPGGIDAMVVDAARTRARRAGGAAPDGRRPRRGREADERPARGDQGDRRGLEARRAAGGREAGRALRRVARRSTAHGRRGVAMMPRPLWAPWRLDYVEGVDKADRCVFCEPDEGLVVHRGENAFVLLNLFPYTSGHALVVPVRHERDFVGLTAEEALEIHQLAAATATALRNEYSPDGLNLGWNLGRAAGAGIVDHVHLHVVPRWSGDTNFMPVLADAKVIPEALAETAGRLRRRFAAG